MFLGGAEIKKNNFRKANKNCRIKRIYTSFYHQIIIYICIQKQPNTFKKEFGMVCKWSSVYYYTKKYNNKKGIMKNARK